MTNYRRNLLALDADADLAIALEITHPDLVEPIRVVQGTEDLYVTLNDDGAPVTLKFQACQFSITWPDDVDGQVSKATLAVTNIGRQLTEWLEFSRGGRGAKARLLQLTRSDVAPYLPDFDDYSPGYFAEDYVATPGDTPPIGFDPFEVDIELDMMNLAIDLGQVTADLGYKLASRAQAVARRFDPKTAPGLWG